LANFNYIRDNADQLASVTSTGVPADNNTYTYTALNQLKTVNTTSYGYDTADSLTKLADGTNKTYDASNQLCWTGADRRFLPDTTSRSHRIRLRQPGQPHDQNGPERESGSTPPAQSSTTTRTNRAHPDHQRPHRNHHRHLHLRRLRTTHRLDRLIEPAIRIRRRIH